MCSGVLCVCLSVCVRVLGALEPELETALRCHMGVGSLQPLSHLCSP